MRQIPLKNYLLVIVILVATFFATLSIVDKFKDEDSQEKTMTIEEIKENELDNYLTERQEAIIYISSNKKDEEINKKVDKYINKKNLVEKVVYLDKDELSEDFDNQMKTKYKKEINTNTPNLVVFSNRKITKVVKIVNHRTVNVILSKVGELK